MTSNWQLLTTNAPAIDIEGLSDGTYEIEVVAVGADGSKSTVSTVQQTIVTQVSVPSNITYAAITPVNDTSAILSWSPAVDALVKVGGRTLIRHQPVTTGATWSAATEIVSNVSGSDSSATVPLLQGTYLVKFETSTGIKSNAVASTVILSTRPSPRYLVSNVQEQPGGFAGTKTGLYFNSTLNGLSIEYGWDTLAPTGDFDAVEDIDLSGGVISGGTYDFANAIDLGNTYDLNLLRYLVVTPSLIFLDFDSYIGDMDTWGDFEGNDVSDTNAAIYVRSTTDDPSASPTWSEWRPCTNNLLRGRGFQFRLTLTSNQVTQNIAVTQAGVTVELQQRTETSAVLTTAAGAYSATFANAFYLAPAVNITPVNMAAGDYFTLASISATGFQVSFFDSGANAISRQFTYTAVGYGRRI